MFLSKQYGFFALALALTNGRAQGAIEFETSNSAHADATIEAEILTRLDAHPGLGSTTSIHVQSIGGVVYLYGVVDSYQAKALVQSIAAQSSDVVRVVNSIEQENF